MIGGVGQLLILLGFVSSVFAALAYFQSARTESAEWLRIGRYAWFATVAAVLVASGLLLYLLLTHQFQYAYVYQQTSLDLPLHFLISSFWAGQEGSFLLWIVFMSLLGLILVRQTREWEAPVMTFVALSQVFLISMIVGLKLGPLGIGASPFTTLAEKFPDAPMLQVPGFIPADGSGLNDLLQNYWMAIHPPTLFTGFTMMVVPFSFAAAGLWKRRYTEWVRPALPWALTATAVLGVGIMLGGYWAYETLSFGGWWAWDPVENSSLVPWIIGIAAIHSMIIQKKSGRGHKSALFLNVLAYMCVIYSTFLTRSGILGDVSVHSFVDLGMMNQLLLWILTVGVIGFGLFAHRYRELPTPTHEPNLLSREFMIFSGAMLLVAASMVVAVGTSSPILGKLFREAPSTVPIEFYNRWTLPLSVLIVFLAGLGQLFWWNKMSIENANRVLLKPIALSVASTLAVLILTPFVDETIRSSGAPAPSGIVQAGLAGGLEQFWVMYGIGLLMLLLVFAAFFAVFGNGLVLWRIGRGNPRMAGGAIAHVGFALMILGIIASSGFSRPIAEGSGVLIGESRDNFVLARGESRVIDGFRVTYSGQERTERNRPVYVLNFIDPAGREFELRPVVYKSAQEQWIQHPDHKIYSDRDIFVAVSPSAMFESSSDDGDQPEKGGQLTISRGDSVVVGNDEFAIKFIGYNTNVDPSLLPDSTEIAVAALLDVTNLSTMEMRRLSPVYLIMQDRTQQYIQNRVADWRLNVTFIGMNVDSGSINLHLEGVDVEAEDWIVVQAYVKPMMNLLWFGFLMLSGGMGLAIYRRFSDQRFEMRRRTQEL